MASWRERLAVGLATIVSVLLTSEAWADHGGRVSPTGGLGLGWLLVAGAVVTLGLAGWAFLAPERDDDSERTPGRAARR
jgi:hypothetical protein